MIRYIFENDYKKLMVQELDFLKKDSKVLNLACENILMPSFLKNVVNELNFSGIEINRAITDADSRIKLCNVDEDHFPFADAFFDTVLSVWGMEHFQGINVFCESSRVLKSNGNMVFVTPNANNPAFTINKIGGEKLGRFYYKFFLGGRYVPHRAFYKFNDKKSILRAAQQAGMVVESITYFGPSNFLDYFTFSKTLQKLVTLWERAITNRWLYFLKPYIVVTLRKQ